MTQTYGITNIITNLYKEKEVIQFKIDKSNNLLKLMELIGKREGLYRAIEIIQREISDNENLFSGDK